MTKTQHDLPVATVQPIHRARWVWLIPLVAVVFAAFLYATHVVKRGSLITLTLEHGHGIKAGDVVRCRGIEIGAVEHVSLDSKTLSDVRLRVRLEPAAKDVARAGSRFWVQRPRLSLTGIGGLETIAGPRYLAVLPGDGPPQRKFVALDEPPVVEAIEPDGLEIELIAQQRGSLRPGAPIAYRHVHIGAVLSVGLSNDATAVVMRAYIHPPYAALVRDNSRFWNVSGADLQLGIKGLRFEIESLQSLLDGGIALATPDDPGSRVGTGHRFKLYAEEEDEWLRWRPALPVGAAWLPSGAQRPQLMRLTRKTASGKVWKKTAVRRGWALQLESGLIGPTALLSGSSDEDGEVNLELGGAQLRLSDLTARKMGRLTLIETEVANAAVWPAGNCRTMEAAEDCVLITDASSRPIPLSAAHLNYQSKQDIWLVDPAISLDVDLHGAAVMARNDGFMVGVLLVEKGLAYVSRLGI